MLASSDDSAGSDTAAPRLSALRFDRMRSWVRITAPTKSSGVSSSSMLGPDAGRMAVSLLGSSPFSVRRYTQIANTRAQGSGIPNSRDHYEIVTQGTAAPAHEYRRGQAVWHGHRARQWVQPRTVRRR